MSNNKVLEVRKLSYMIYDLFVLSSSYDAAYGEILNIINRENITRKEMSLVEINADLNASLDEWLGEKPPLMWYSLCLSYYFACIEIPFDSLILLMRSANYYGNYRIVLDIYEKNRDIDLLISDKCRYYKEVAKAYKNIGLFDESSEIYREILESTAIEYKNSYHAYYLMLYAKLCNDYQQRQGLYIGLHKIAYDRIKKYNEISQFDQHHNWEYISRDSFAKSIFSEEPSIAIKHYEEMLFSDKIQDDSMVRIKSHYYGLSIMNLIKSNEYDELMEKKIYGYYDEYKELIKDIKLRDNTRAYNIRSVQFLQVSRSMIYWMQRLRLKISSEFNDLINGEALSVLKLMINSSYIYNDWKTSIYALMEMPYWLRMKGGEGNDEEIYEVSISYLSKAKNIIKDKYKSYLSEVYYEVLTSLAYNYIKIRNWDSAADAYKEIYEYIKTLIDVVEKDEKLVDSCLKYEQEFAFSNTYPEFNTLSYLELNEIRNRMAIDYKHLLKRMIFISDKLYSLRMTQIAYTKEHDVILSNNFKYHALSERLRRLIDDTAKHKDINDKLKDFNESLKAWSKEEKYMLEKKEIDLGRELLLALNENLTVNENVLLIKDIPKSVKIVFNEFTLRRVLDGLILNVIEASKRYITSDPYVYVGVHVDEEEKVYLVVGDNVGEFEKLAVLIELINRGEMLDRIKKEAYGLYLIKEMVRLLTFEDFYISLNKINEKEKKIFIPLGCLLNEKN